MNLKSKILVNIIFLSIIYSCSKGTETFVLENKRKNSSADQSKTDPIYSPDGRAIIDSEMNPSEFDPDTNTYPNNPDTDTNTDTNTNTNTNTHTNDSTIEYFTSIPYNPIRTVYDLFSKSLCSNLTCGNGFDGCRAVCLDEFELYKNINCNPPDTQTYPPNKIDCSSSYFQAFNVAIKKKFNSSINANTDISSTFEIYVCNSFLEDANYDRQCRAKNIGITGRPKKFNVLMAYTEGNCTNTGSGSNSYGFTMFRCSQRETINAIFEKVKCNNEQSDYSNCVKDNFTFGIRQYSTYIEINDEISTFEILDCINNKRYSACQLR